MGKLKEKLANFWYYYKWHTLIVIFFVSVLTVCAVQLFTREVADIKILYAGPTIISESKNEEIQTALNDFLSSEKNESAELFGLIIMDDKQLKDAYDKGYNPYFLNEKVIEDNKNTLTFQSMAGEYLIFLVDESCYDSLYTNNVFIKLDDCGITKGIRKDECSIYLKSTDFAKFYTCFDIFPDSTLLCIKRIQVNKKGESKNKEAQERHIEFVKLLLDYKIPEGFEE